MDTKTSDSASDLGRAFEPLRTGFALFALLLGLAAAARGAPEPSPLAAPARDGHPPAAAEALPIHEGSGGTHVAHITP